MIRKAIGGSILATILLGAVCSVGFLGIVTAWFAAMETVLPAPARPIYRAWMLGQRHPDLHVGGVCVPENLPVEGPITLDFGVPYGEGAPAALRGRAHAGIDIAVPVGTPVKVPIAGTVVFAGYDLGWPSYGNLVVVCNGPVCVYLAHLSEIRAAPGARVEAGQTVGASGNTGTSTGPHLHYEVRVDGRPVDPRVLDPIAAACRAAAAGGAGGGGTGPLVRRAPAEGPWGWLRYWGPPARIWPEEDPAQAVGLRAGEAVTVAVPISFTLAPAGAAPLSVAVPRGGGGHPGGGRREVTVHAFRLRRGRILWPLDGERGERLPAGAVVIGTWHTPGVVLDVVEVILDGRPWPVRGYLAWENLLADLEPVGDIGLTGQASVEGKPGRVSGKAWG